MMNNLSATFAATVSRVQLSFSDPFTLIFNVGMMISLGLPMLAYMIARLTNEQYQQEQQNQQEQNQEDYQQQYYQQNYDQYGNYVGPTHWWQFWKKNNNGYYYGEDQQQQQEEQNDRENEIRSPWWYIWGDDREGERGDPEIQGKGAMIFIYLWTLLLVAGLIYLANTTDMKAAKLEKFRWALTGFLNYCLVTMILLTSLEGGIQVEGRDLEEDGWYGQTAVLIFLTCLFGLIQSIAYIVWSGKRIGNKEEIKSSDDNSADGYVDVGDGGASV
mmetsp:Transcript_39063/g.94473  ORF Transcript_39063/g.94473 Transcript_39063/m.94473 type:complete len:273 (+) Transcript_39063:311-1129(+)|eukprot:CAMPEP_0113454862 /NCGR_PEP_ID=MMETSP0014_2-20120614/8081_1 /TAXON_ID=2857 /ORGANISM="Nitzschia sp." /LENGTH=272 /DNA_ID=CAMNT_0000346279 /DNA_START=741 /DNA_END=1559 /DNA_ORIENTATION=+ /assembly_acc=CAM_ASM_000159